VSELKVTRTAAEALARRAHARFRALRHRFDVGARVRRRKILQHDPGRARPFVDAVIVNCSRRFGLTSDTLIYLPHVNVAQGYYALKSLPGDEVSLYWLCRGYVVELYRIAR